MKSIKRTISKEPYISRLPGLILPIDEEYGINGNYGKIVSSVNFTSIPDLEYLNTLSYRTLISRYYWINNLYNNTIVYKCVQTTINGYEWLVYNQDIAFDDIRLKSVLPIPSSTEANGYVGLVDQTYIDTYNKLGGIIFYKFVERSLGKVITPPDIIKELTPSFIYLTELDDWYNMISTYKNSSDCCLIEKYVKIGGDNFYFFLDNLKNSNILESEKAYFKSISTLDKCDINLNININSSIDNIGIVNPIIEEWVPGRTYYTGDMVIYNNNVYKLKEIEGGYNGFYCEIDRSIYFDVLNEVGEITLTHWIDHLDGTEEVNQTLIENKVESRLIALRSLINDYDDNGFALPGLLVIKDGSEPNERLYENYLDLIYKKDLPLNIEEITYITHNGNVETDYFGDIIYDINVVGSQITFNYVIGCKFNFIIENNGGVEIKKLNYDPTINSSGVRYNETYYLEEKILADVIVDGNLYTFTYKDIDTNSNIVNITMSDMSNFNRPAIMSNSHYLNNEMYIFNELSGEWDYVNTPTFKEEYLMGVSSQPKIDSNIFINRGASAAFERHLKIGEIHTMQDMEAYGNSSFFVMKE